MAKKKKTSNKDKAWEELQHVARSLAEAAEQYDVPHDHIFTDADDYPEFDQDPAANYLTGIITGAAAVYGRDGASLFRDLLK